METINFFNLNHADLKQTFAENQLPTFAAEQVFSWVYKKQSLDFSEWSNVSKHVKEFLFNHINFDLPKVVWHGLSSDGTRKFLLKMNDGQTVESVAIPSRERLTLCISSQVGCAIGCTFCHTATQGLKRHLQAAEVVGQYFAVTLWLAQNVSPDTKLTNIVYMGQGEPLHNFENMKKATEIFLDQKAFGLGQRKITLSTSGLVPQIEKLAEFPPVNIAISLHAARNDVRSELMPINKVYDLDRLFKAIKTIPLKAYRRITYEYLLIDGLNDQMIDVEALSKLISRSESKINLIPFNEYPTSKFKRPSNQHIDWFMDQLIKRGFTCTVRQTKGSDILAACGQLKSHVEKLNLWKKDEVSL